MFMTSSVVVGTVIFTSGSIVGLDVVNSLVVTGSVMFTSVSDVVGSGVAD